MEREKKRKILIRCLKILNSRSEYDVSSWIKMRSLSLIGFKNFKIFRGLLINLCMKLKDDFKSHIQNMVKNRSRKNPDFSIEIKMLDYLWYERFIHLIFYIKSYNLITHSRSYKITNFFFFFFFLLIEMFLKSIKIHQKFQGCKFLFISHFYYNPYKRSFIRYFRGAFISKIYHHF